MRERPNRRNAELEAFDRALRGETGTTEQDPATPDDISGNTVDSDPGHVRSVAEDAEGTVPGSAGRDDAGSSRGRPDDAGSTRGGSSAPGSQGAADPNAAAPSQRAVGRRHEDGAGVAEDEDAPPAPRTAPYGEAEGEDGVSTEVLARDLIIFQVKLLLDGLKDLVLSPLSIAAVVWDLIPSQKGYRGRTFYKVLKIGERFDLWLNLYTPARDARLENQGLLEAGVHSADSLMGKLEQLAREEADRQARKGKQRKGGGWGDGLG